jgi:hypothetical protein
MNSNRKVQVERFIEQLDRNLGLEMRAKSIYYNFDFENDVPLTSSDIS